MKCRRVEGGCGGCVGLGCSGVREGYIYTINGLNYIKYFRELN